MSSSMNLIFETMDLQHASVSLIFWCVYVHVCTCMCVCVYVCVRVWYIIFLVCDICEECSNLFFIHTACHSQQMWYGVPGTIQLRLEASVHLVVELLADCSEGKLQRANCGPL